MRLWHATTEENAEAILRDGFRKGSYFGTEPIADYYLETVKDDGDEPILLSIELDDAPGLRKYLVPDYNGIEEPIASVLKTSDEEIWRHWEASERTWKDSLRLIGSIRIDAPIPASAISRH